MSAPETRRGEAIFFWVVVGGSGGGSSSSVPPRRPFFSPIDLPTCFFLPPSRSHLCRGCSVPGRMPSGFPLNPTDVHLCPLIFSSLGQNGRLFICFVVLLTAARHTHVPQPLKVHGGASRHVGKASALALALAFTFQLLQSR